MFDRSVPLQQTLALVPELKRNFGITRVGETTYLDRTFIPTYCAIVPKSPDVLSVYNGKGTTREAAMVSAVMEAVERQVGAAPRVATYKCRIEEVCQTLDLESLGLFSEASGMAVDCAAGVKLSTGEDVPVPMALIQCPWEGVQLFPTQSASGLASGNTPTEALYHALMELIERHVYSLAIVRSEIAPRYYGGPDATDTVHYRALQFPTGDDDLDELVERIVSAGLHMRVMMLCEADLPIVAVATIVEPGSHPAMAHQGMGCSLSPRHAAARAVTEAVQSRVVDIQAARDDILRSDDPSEGYAEHTRRPSAIPRGRWFLDLPADKVSLSDLESRSSSDIATDVRTAIALLCDAGHDSVVYIDLSPEDCPVSVVRVIAPSLEDTYPTGRIGPEALRLLHPFRLMRRSFP